MITAEIIKSKRDRQELSSEAIEQLIQGYSAGDIPDYQMSAFLMACFLNGLTESETHTLTAAMLNSGDRVDFSPELYPVDKHSTGGVGDKTSLILAPIVAACDIPVPMMSGRGLGHTGGTLDKLEAIPGFQVHLDLPRFKKQVEEYRLCFIGQTDKICPADKKIYALRDVTATVESLPLICASIMSKKIAEGIRGLVLDVKTGSGAFMKTPEQSLALAKGLISIGRAHGIKTQALITDMNQPLGRFVGNALEVHECLSILKRQSYGNWSHHDFKDTEDLSVKLAAMMIAMAKNISLNDAEQQALAALDSGKAYEVFEKICTLQGGRLHTIPNTTYKRAFIARKTGHLAYQKMEQMGVAGILLKAGRRLITDAIDPRTGIEVHKKWGEFVTAGETLFTLHTDEKNSGFQDACQCLEQVVLIQEEPIQENKLIWQSLLD